MPRHAAFVTVATASLAAFGYAAMLPASNALVAGGLMLAAGVTKLAAVAFLLPAKASPSAQTPTR